MHKRTASQDPPATIAKIKDIKVNGNYYVLDANILERQDTLNQRSHPFEEYFAKAIIGDNTAQIPLILPDGFPISDLMPGIRIKVIGKALYIGD